MQLSRITIFPVKSLDGIDVPEASITPLGALEHDRRWAIIDAAGNFVNAKRTDRLHRIRARFSPTLDAVTLSTPSESPVEFPLDANPELAAWLGSALEQPVRLIQDRQQGFPDDLDANGPTVVTKDSLAEVAGWFGLPVDETRRRFRTNLEVSGTPPFFEDRLFGAEGETREFLLGSVRFLGIDPCQRCAVPARDSLSGLPVAGFQKLFMQKRQETLPAASERSRFNHFYRLGVNTRIPAGQSGSRLRPGLPLILPNLAS